MISLLLTNMAGVLASRLAAITWVCMFSSVSGQALYKLELNEKVGEGIFVGSFQTDGYARDDTSLRYNDSINAPLLSYTYCHRIQMFYTRPRMYISTYAFNNEESNELYSEYHLGRAAFRSPTSVLRDVDVFVQNLQERDKVLRLAQRDAAVQLLEAHLHHLRPLQGLLQTLR